MRLTRDQEQIKNTTLFCCCWNCLHPTRCKKTTSHPALKRQVSLGPGLMYIFNGHMMQYIGFSNNMWLLKVSMQIESGARGIFELLWAGCDVVFYGALPGSLNCGRFTWLTESRRSVLADGEVKLFSTTAIRVWSSLVIVFPGMFVV